MYKKIPNLETPPDDAKLWRYMDFTKFVSLLDQQALFFARGDLLDDPFEGTLLKANVAYWDIFRKSRPSALINSWHENDHESAAMWKLYAKDSAGIAIRTNFRKFTRSLIDNQDISVGRVKYDPPEKSPSSLIDPFFYKRPSFSHEREVRAIIQSAAHYLLGDYPASLNIADSAFSFSGRGTYARVDLSELVQEVVTSPYADDWFHELAQSLAQRYGLTASVRRSSLSDQPTWGHHL